MLKKKLNMLKTNMDKCKIYDGFLFFNELDLIFVDYSSSNFSLYQLADKYNSNIEQIAVAWIHKLGALPIIGSLSKDRIRNAATASDIALTYQDWHAIYEITKTLNA